MLENITIEKLDELAAGEQPVILDLYTTWCGQCKMLGPIFDRVAAKTEDKAIFAKVDVDVCPEIAERFGVQNVPVVVALKGGETVHQSHGIMNEPSLTALVEKLA